MLRRTIVISATLGLAAGALAVALASQHRASSPTTAATAAVEQTPAPTAQPTPPPMPDGVVHPPKVVTLTLSGTTRSLDCQTSRRGNIAVEQPSSQPTTAHEIFAVSPFADVVTATESRGYWQRDDGHLPTENALGTDWAPLTATNFSVQRTLKGGDRSWVQVIDEGADPKSVASCSNLALVVDGLPLPVVGQRYVLFLQLDRGRGVLRDELGPLDYFPIVNGMVHSPLGGHDMPLDQFLATLG